MVDGRGSSFVENQLDIYFWSEGRKTLNRSKNWNKNLYWNELKIGNIHRGY